ncbi:hypothetical protein QR680_006479 [Steinernema hermaphroditum]|uniref:F-box domain-containing protein n=2 Tax=Steinernema hermaphroditum TaxID=289476 RepID=A0AA39LX80_9BILA|nr:hypothetical protein QR680_006479 [Steinernema hermaphroditum]
MNLSSLPSSILSRLFDNFNSQEQWSNVRLTCKRFRKLIDEKVTYRMCITSSNAAVTLSIAFDMDQKGLFLKELDFSNWGSSGVDGCLQRHTAGLLLLDKSNCTAVTVKNNDCFCPSLPLLIRKLVLPRVANSRKMSHFTWDGGFCCVLEKPSISSVLSEIIHVLPENMESLKVPLDFMYNNGMPTFKRLISLRPKNLSISIPSSKTKLLKDKVKSMRCAIKDINLSLTEMVLCPETEITQEDERLARVIETRISKVQNGGRPM